MVAGREIPQHFAGHKDHYAIIGGAACDGKNIKKHRNDVFRLAQLLPADASIKLANPIREDLQNSSNSSSRRDPQPQGI